MPSSTTFKPKHPQPFTLEQAMQLEVEMLVTEITRLENSIAHLERTQSELLRYLRDEDGEDDDGELGKAVKENEDVIASQTERIELIRVALRNKIGEGGMRHYGIREPMPSRTPQPLPTQQDRGPGPGATTPPSDDGVYL